METKKTLRAGVIGLQIGQMHIRGYREHPQVAVAAIADVNGERLQAVGEELGVAARYEDWRRMLANENLDVVSVCVPNVLHREITIGCLEAGCHVLCEKPMALNAAESEEMLAAARRTGRRLMIDFSYRFTEQGRALKAQVDAGILGDVYFGRTVFHRRRGIPGFGTWFTDKGKSGGGPLIDLGVHRLDLALWLMGNPEPQWVMGATYDRVGSRLAREQGKHFDVEDLAAAMVRFRNGASLIVEASWASNIAENELMETRLLGTRAGLVHRNVRESYEFEAEIYLEHEGCQYDMKMHPPFSACRSAMHHFADCILTGAPHMATAEDGVAVMRVIDAIYRSAATGSPVSL